VRSSCKPPIWVTRFVNGHLPTNSVWVMSAGQPAPVETKYSVAPAPQSYRCDRAVHVCKLRKPELLAAFSTDRDLVAVAWVSVNMGCGKRAHFEPTIRMPFHYSVVIEAPKLQVPPVLCSTRPIRAPIAFAERFSGSSPPAVKVKVSPTETEAVPVVRASVP
jgi:hypothetical protein